MLKAIYKFLGRENSCELEVRVLFWVPDEGWRNVDVVFLSNIKTMQSSLNGAMDTQPEECWISEVAGLPHVTELLNSRNSSYMSAPFCYDPFGNDIFNIFSCSCSNTSILLRGTQCSFGTSDACCPEVSWIFASFSKDRRLPLRLFTTSNVFMVIVFSFSGMPSPSRESQTYFCRSFGRPSQNQWKVAE